MSTTAQRRAITRAIADLLRDRPDHDTPPAARAGWCARPSCSPPSRSRTRSDGRHTTITTTAAPVLIGKGSLPVAPPPNRTAPSSNRGQAGAERWRGSIFSGRGSTRGLVAGLGGAPRSDADTQGARAPVTLRRAIIGDDDQNPARGAGVG